MKARITTTVIAIIILITVSVSVCLLRPNRDYIKTEILTLSDTVYLSDTNPELGNISFDFNIEFPVKTKKNIHIIDTITYQIRGELFEHSFMKCPNASVLQNYATSLAKDYIKNNAEFASKIADSNPISFHNAVILEGFASYNQNKILAYGIMRFLDYGGAHPITTRRFLNFNLSDGKQITEQELFIADYQQELTEIIKTKLLYDLNSQTESAQIVNLNETDYYDTEIQPNGNFYINEAGICYVFNPYEIAPYYMGETEVFLPFELLQHLLLPNNPLQNLVRKSMK